MYKERKNDGILLFEKLNHGEVRLYKYPVLYALKPVIGIIFIVFSLLLLVNYSVGKMLIAMFLHSIGVLFIISTDGYLLSGFIRKFRHLYYKNIIKWNNLFYQYKINVKVIFIIYILNFLLTFIIGGLIVSDSSESNKEKYPYDMVIYGNEISKNIEDSYRCITVDINSIGKATAISNSDFNKITQSNLEITKNSILYYREKAAEEFLPLENKSVLFIPIPNKEHNQEYKILEADWKILFGENIFPELDTIVVLNDEDFLLFAENNKVSTIIATNNKEFIQKIEGKISDRENKIWFKSEQLEKEKISNRMIEIIIYIIGLIFILESQSFVMIRQILDEKKEDYQYKILNQLGIISLEWRRIQIDKIKSTLFFPEILAIVTGIYFFLCDYFYQTQMNIEWRTLFQYSAVLVSFGFIQYIGYRITINMVNNYYKKKNI